MATRLFKKTKEMKHFTLALTMFMAAAGLQAQTVNHVVTLGNDDDYFIPAEYSADGKSHIVSMDFFGDDYDDNNDFNKICIYDDDLNIIKSFNIPFNPGIYEEIGCFNYNTGLSYTDLNMAVTQTLFNNDENYEYISPIRTSNAIDDMTGFKIVSDNGEVLQTIT